MLWVQLQIVASTNNCALGYFNNIETYMEYYCTELLILYHIFFLIPPLIIRRNGDQDETNC